MVGTAQTRLCPPYGNRNSPHIVARAMMRLIPNQEPMHVFSVPFSAPFLRTVIEALIDGRLVDGFDCPHAS